MIFRRFRRNVPPADRRFEYRRLKAAVKIREIERNPGAPRQDDQLPLTKRIDLGAGFGEAPQTGRRHIHRRRHFLWAAERFDGF